MIKKILLTIILTLFMASCVNHIDPYRPKKRVYKYDGPKKKRSYSNEGSLWSDNSKAGTLFTEYRASNEGDLITIIVSENASATGEAVTESGRSSNTDISVDSVFNFMKYLKKKYPDIDNTSLIKQSYLQEFAGNGKTTRKGNITATITATVKQILPSGNYFIEGQKVILVNSEEHHFYISGVINPNDIDEGNIIYSNKIAEAQIEFTGRGSISSQQSQGWFSQALDWIWPF